MLIVKQWEKEYSPREKLQENEKNSQFLWMLSALGGRSSFATGPHLPLYPTPLRISSTSFDIQN